MVCRPCEIIPVTSTTVAITYSTAGEDTLNFFLQINLENGPAYHLDVFYVPCGLVPLPPNITSSLITKSDGFEFAGKIKKNAEMALWLKH